MSITQEQLQMIMDKVNRLTADKAMADQRSQNANQQDANVATVQAQLTTAQAAQAQSKIDEAQADAQVNSDVNDLLAYLESLQGGSSPTTTIPPTTTLAPSPSTRSTRSL